MKTYKFDYIREMVDQWHPTFKKTKRAILGTPWRVTPPWIDWDSEEHRLKVTTPSKDYYGEVIDDIEEWMRQRDEYCEKLWKEYEAN